MPLAYCILILSLKFLTSRISPCGHCFFFSYCPFFTHWIPFHFPSTVSLPLILPPYPFRLSPLFSPSSLHFSSCPFLQYSLDSLLLYVLLSIRTQTVKFFIFFTLFSFLQCLPNGFYLFLFFCLHLMSICLYRQGSIKLEKLCMCEQGLWSPGL